jgi:uncharacterized LabA/DUF88 family protein
MWNYAFIDSQNLHIQMKQVWWKIDYKKFRVYLREKYNVDVAYLFIGYMSEHKYLYNQLQKEWYILNFKEILVYKDWSVKWNVDAELVLQAMIDYNNYDKAVIITWDWDFACLVRYLHEKDKLKVLLVPDEKDYSCLLNKPAKGKIAFVNRLQNKVQK